MTALQLDKSLLSVVSRSRRARSPRPVNPGAIGSAAVEPMPDHLLTDPTDALSAVPAAGSRRATPVVGHLRFYYGPMDCGKSTLALQVDHNQGRQGRRGLLLVHHDRSGKPQISSRIGITRQALEVQGDVDLRNLVRARWAEGVRVDYLIVDEAQFLTPDQVDQLAELADDVQVDVLCWCGLPARFNARVSDGVVIRAGDTVLVADTERETPDPTSPATVRYQVLCRRHFRVGDLGPAVAGRGQLSFA